jgi:hypothetical protein
LPHSLWSRPNSTRCSGALGSDVMLYGTKAPLLADRRSELPGRNVAGDRTIAPFDLSFSAVYKEQKAISLRKVFKQTHP